MTTLSSSISNSKKAGVYIICSLITICGLLISFDFLFTKYVIFYHKWSEISQIKRLYNTENPNEIPIFGSSLAQRSYYVDSLGDNYHVYGMAGSNFQKMYPLLEEEFSKERTTPIIFDFYMNTLKRNDTVNIRLRNFIPFARKEIVQEYLKELDLYKAYYPVPGLRYFGNYVDYLMTHQKDKREEQRNYFKKGGAYYLPETDSSKFNNYVKKRLITHESFEVDSAFERRFKKLIAQRPDRMVILVKSPHHWSCYKSSVDLDAVEDYLHSLEKEFSNVRVLIYDGKDYPDNYFKDTIHMNIRGARKFSGILIKDLLRIFR